MNGEERQNIIDQLEKSKYEIGYMSQYLKDSGKFNDWAIILMREAVLEKINKRLEELK